MRSGGFGGWDIWMTQRTTVEDPWETPVNLGSGVNNAQNEYPTSISSNGLTLYFFTGTYTFRQYTATRATRDASWGPRVDLGPVINSGGIDLGAMISPDDLELFLVSSRPGGLGGLDICVSTRATPTSPWEPLVNLGPVVNTPGNEATGPMSPDGLTMFMNAENRPGGCGGWDTWIIRRPSKNAPWSEPVNLGTLFNTPDGECLFSLSPDGQWAYGNEYVGTPVGNLWMVPIIPTVDFSGDGMLDLVDLAMLIENWGLNNTLYDIGPMPWGDGVVDIEDLKVFIAEWEKENQSTQGDGTTFPDFIATEGSAEGVAVDKAGNVYVSVSATSDQVWKFSAAGVGNVLADLGEPGGGALGLATDAAGNIYACRASVTSAGVLLPNHGVHRIAPDGEVNLLPGTEQIVFANALAFDDQETLYITEMFSGDFSSRSFGPGGLWRLTKGGTAQLWIRHEFLTGMAPSLFPYPVGANGIAFHRGDLYVVNPDKAMIVRVPVQADGSAGLPEIWKKIEDVPESFLYGSPAFPLMIDGVSVGPEGNPYVTVITRNAIVRIDADDRSQQTVAVYPQVPLDTPANVAFKTDKSGDISLFITNMGMLKAFIPDQAWPGPGLVKTSIP